MAFENVGNCGMSDDVTESVSGVTIVATCARTFRLSLLAFTARVAVKEDEPMDIQQGKPKEIGLILLTVMLSACGSTANSRIMRNLKQPKRIGSAHEGRDSKRASVRVTSPWDAATTTPNAAA